MFVLYSVHLVNYDTVAFSVERSVYEGKKPLQNKVLCLYRSALLPPLQEQGAWQRLSWICHWLTHSLKHWNLCVLALEAWYSTRNGRISKMVMRKTITLLPIDLFLQMYRRVRELTEWTLVK